MKQLICVLVLIVLSVTFSNSIAQAPTATFGVSENSVCAGECIEIENTSQNAATSWVWSFGAGATPSSYSGPDPGPVCFPVAGTYTITLTASNVFGTVSTSQTITVTALPSVSATLSDTTNGVYVEIPDTLINMYQEAYLWAEGVPVGGELIWYPSGVSADGFTVNNGDSVIVNPFYDTYYVVSYSINGCTAYDTVFVNVNYQEIVQVPNSFSPNGDGVNDFLKVLTNVDADNNYTNGFVEGGAIAEIDFRIYNRYGILVFKTSDPHEGWDGTFKGKPENPATFVYTIDYRLINGRSSNLKGNVTLFR
jgi:gliding motility-associated-like protein